MMKTLQNNIKISNFMGLTNKDIYFSPVERYKGLDAYQLKYDYDWSWLMKVVEKIESLDLKQFFYCWTEDNIIKYNFMCINVDIEYNTCYILVELELDPPIYINSNPNGTSKIDATYNAILDFINWYNNKLNNIE